MELLGRAGKLKYRRIRLLVLGLLRTNISARHNNTSGHIWMWATVIPNRARILHHRLPRLARIDEAGIEATVIGCGCMRKNVFVLPLDDISRLHAKLRCLKAHLLDNHRMRSWTARILLGYHP